MASLLSYTLAAVNLLTLANAYNWTASPINPPALPLAVRTPYLSVWLPQGTDGAGSGRALNDEWPTFWRLDEIDGEAYSFLGAPSVPGASLTKAIQTSSKYASTQTTFTMTAGSVDLTINFLSPIEPDDLVLQSTPFSYLAVSAASNDGASHSVQVCSDISGEWLVGDTMRAVNWTTTAGDSTLIHQAQLREQTPFAEVDDRVLQGSVYYAVQDSGSTTYQTGQDTVVIREHPVTIVTSSQLCDTVIVLARAHCSDRLG